MQLIGMLDSPYVRRTAISLTLLDIPFEHRSLSVFSTFEQFKAINPVVKAPTLLCDDGSVLMDSSLILQWAEATHPQGRSLWPAPASLQAAFRAVGLALAACEKSVQIVYERNLRPPAAQHAPWLTRVQGQALAAYAALEAQIDALPTLFEAMAHPAITAAVCWQFTQSMLADEISAGDHPQLSALSKRLEQHSVFRQFPPDGPGVQPATD